MLKASKTAELNETRNPHPLVESKQTNLDPPSRQHPHSINIVAQDMVLALIDVWHMELLVARYATGSVHGTVE